MTSTTAPLTEKTEHCYRELSVGGCRVVACEWAEPFIREALAHGTLYEWAANQPVKSEMRGRGAVYAVRVPGSPTDEVVVRRNQHGGLLRLVTGEYFLLPTRAPLELATAQRLAEAGVPTPEVIAYAVYPLLGVFARSDVMTRRLPAGADAPALWRTCPVADREVLLQAIARLLTRLAAAGAWHADLNLKNIYLAEQDAVLTAYLLDVDRVTFPADGDVAGRNFARLSRSVRKWRTRWGLDFDEAALARLAALSQEKTLCE